MACGELKINCEHSNNKGSGNVSQCKTHRHPVAQRIQKGGIPTENSVVLRRPLRRLAGFSLRNRGRSSRAYLCNNVGDIEGHGEEGPPHVVA